LEVVDVEAVEPPAAAATTVSAVCWQIRSPYHPYPLAQEPPAEETGDGSAAAAAVPLTPPATTGEGTAAAPTTATPPANAAASNPATGSLNLSTSVTRSPVKPSRNFFSSLFSAVTKDSSMATAAITAADGATAPESLAASTAGGKPEPAPVPAEDDALDAYKADNVFVPVMEPASPSAAEPPSEANAGGGGGGGGGGDTGGSDATPEVTAPAPAQAPAATADDETY
jgi:hypothetical protein